MAAFSFVEWLTRTARIWAIDRLWHVIKVVLADSCGVYACHDMLVECLQTGNFTTIFRLQKAIQLHLFEQSTCLHGNGPSVTYISQIPSTDIVVEMLVVAMLFPSLVMKRNNLSHGGASTITQHNYVNSWHLFSKDACGDTIKRALPRGKQSVLRKHSGFEVYRIIPGVSLTAMTGENTNLFCKESSNAEETSESEGRQESQNVFLCHSGKQKNFVRQLHKDLTKAGLSCFFDEDPQSLPLAHKFPSRIFLAAETCKVALLVLSEDFFQSKWPILELSAFLRNIKSGKNPNLKILPIFYMIEPKFLSQITQDYPQWQALESSLEIRAEWQNAVREVRSYNGLVLKEGENEVSFRDKVVRNMCSLLLLPQPPMLHMPPPPPQAARKRRKVLHRIRLMVIISTVDHNMPCFFNLSFFLQQLCSSDRYCTSVFAKFG